MADLRGHPPLPHDRERRPLDAPRDGGGGGGVGCVLPRISDHSASARYANGLSEEDLAKQGREIDRWNESGRKLRILKGSEVDILPDGSLDYPDHVLGSARLRGGVGAHPFHDG
jgi:hypothetical protein